MTATCKAHEADLQAALARVRELEKTLADSRGLNAQLMAEVQPLRETNTRLRGWLVDLHAAALARYQRDKDYADVGAGSIPTPTECPCCQQGIDWHRPHCALYVDGIAPASDKPPNGQPDAQGNGQWSTGAPR